VPLVQFSWKVTVPLLGAVRFWLPLVGNVPRLDQMVLPPWVPLQEVVLVEVQFKVMFPPGVTTELEGEKLVMVGTGGGLKAHEL
jgi:hypothetical protein